MEVILLPEAEVDLEEIAAYIARDNPMRAVTFVLELRAACVSLADMPEAFPLVPRFAVFGIRRRIHGVYQIFHRPMGKPVYRIDVLRILHGSRDITPLLM